MDLIRWILIRVSFLSILGFLDLQKAVYILKTLKKKQNQNKIDENQYHILHQAKLEELWNSGFKQHLDSNPNCKGNLKMEKTEVRCLSLSFCLICKTCDFRSSSHKLYQEVETGKRGKNPSTLNRAIGMALLGSSIGPTGFRELLLILGLNPGSQRGLQMQINQCCDAVTQLAEDNMNQECKILADVFPEGIDIAVDGRYNNRFSAGPFQAGTQAQFTTCELMSDQKKIINCQIINKLCRFGSEMMRKGEEITCPGHEGCTANVERTFAIGSEGIYANRAAKELEEKKLKVNTVTSDGDSKIESGVTEVFEKAINLKDSVHLSKSIKKKAVQYEFSEEMLGSGPKKTSDASKKWFLEDLKNRCAAEFTNAVTNSSDILDKTKNIANIKSLLENVPLAIINCYQGDCRQCQEHSLACDGVSKPWRAQFVLSTMQKNDHDTTRSENN